MGSSPKPPDPYQTAQAQGAANREAAWASAIVGNANEVNPYGTINYTQSGTERIKNDKGKWIEVPRYTRTTTLSPEQQRLYNLQTATQTNLGQLGVSQSNRLQGLLGTNLNTKGLQGWESYADAPGLATTFGGNNPMTMKIGNAGAIDRDIGNYGTVRQDQGPTDRNAIETAMLARYRQNAGRDDRAEDARLAAQGLTVGSGAYGSVQQDRSRRDVDAYQQAYLASGEEARAAQNAYNAATGQRYQQMMGEAQFGNQAQQQAYQQMAQNAQFANQAQQQAYTQAMQRAGFSNDQIMAMFNAQNAATQNNNALRQQQLAERQNIRNAPINEISALMSGSQVTAPQGAAYNAPQVNAAPIGQYINQNYQSQLANYQNTLNGLFGLGGGLLNLFMPT